MFAGSSATGLTSFGHTYQGVGRCRHPAQAYLVVDDVINLLLAHGTGVSSGNRGPGPSLDIADDLLAWPWGNVGTSGLCDGRP